MSRNKFWIKAKRLYREWRSSLISWVVKWIGGSAVVTAIGRAVWLSIHRAPVDWALLFGLLLVGLLLLVGAFLLQIRKQSDEDHTFQTKEPEQADDALLREITAVIHEMLDFVKKHPELPLAPGEFIPAGAELRFHRLHSGFSLEIYPKLEKVLHKLAVQGLVDYGLNDLANPNNPSGGGFTDLTIPQMAERLLRLRDNWELREYKRLEKDGTKKRIHRGIISPGEF
jgi:hypothetical protein